MTMDQAEGSLGIAHTAVLPITDANAHQTSFAHDAYGRMTQTTLPSNVIETYGFSYDTSAWLSTGDMGLLTGISTQYSFLPRTFTNSYSGDCPEA